jgi:quercetin dioxygenase-like cupin family protein
MTHPVDERSFALALFCVKPEFFKSTASRGTLFMPFSEKHSVFFFVVFCLALVPTRTAQSQTSTKSSSSKERQTRIVFSHSLPRLDGNHLKVTMVEVSYGPGESSLPHSHPCPVIGYVLEGSVRMKTKGEAEAVYRAGESFYESPNGVHEVSANASPTKVAKFIAYFVCDRETPLSVAPVSQ